jgi:hypothetical protein
MRQALASRTSAKKIWGRNTGQMLVKCWSNTWAKKARRRRRSLPYQGERNGGVEEDQHYDGGNNGQILVKKWSNAEKMRVA